MGLLDPIFQAGAKLGRFFGTALQRFDSFIQGLFNARIGDQRLSEILGQSIEDAEPLGEVSTALVDLVEEFVLADLSQEGQLTPQNVEAAADRTEGGAVEVLTAIALASDTASAVSIGQIDDHSEFLVQALAGLGVDDVTGLELEARTAEGIKPALNAKVNREHRSKFANLQDRIEYDLRTKDSDQGYLEDLATYGLRPDQELILQEVALNDMEFEELIETPAELGLVVDDDILTAELDRAGYAEPTKEFLSQVNDRIPKSARAYQELLVSEDHISDLDQRVEDGTLSVGEARERIPDGLEIDERSLQQRWDQKDDLEPDAPSQADFLGALTEGYADLRTTRERLGQAELDTERYEDVFRAEIVGDLDGSLQEAVATGRLSEGEYSDLAEFAGLDDQSIELLLQGNSFSDIVDQRLAAGGGPEERSVRTILGIGESRAQALAAIGIDTVPDLVSADPQAVADAAQVSPETAQQWIDQATARQSTDS